MSAAKDLGPFEAAVGSIDPALPFQARLRRRRLLGDEGVVELVASIGYYSMISLTLDALAIQLPDGVDPIWPD